jgi:hypothetical protein
MKQDCAGNRGERESCKAGGQRAGKNGKHCHDESEIVRQQFNNVLASQSCHHIVAYEGSRRVIRTGYVDEKIWIFAAKVLGRGVIL